MPEEHTFTLTIEASGEVTPAAPLTEPEHLQTEDDDATEHEEAER